MAKNRPLRAVYRRLGRIDRIVEEIIAKQGFARVLEVGCGFGLPMLELKKIFGDRLEIIGVNRLEKFNLPDKALWEGVKQFCFWPWEIVFYKKRFGFPRYVNCDAGNNLPFADSHFDLVYSIATTFFITDKLNLLKEVNRIIRPGCTARIHFSYSASESCSLDQLPDPPYDNLCEIRAPSGRVLDCVTYLDSYDNLNFVEQGGGKPEYLQIKKVSEDIGFDTDFLEGYFLPDVNANWIPYAKSVYRIRH